MTGRMSGPVSDRFFPDGQLAKWGGHMNRALRSPAAVVAIGISVGVILCGQANGEDVSTRLVVQRWTQIYSDTFVVTLNGRRLGNISSGGTLSVEVDLHRDRANVLRVDSGGDDPQVKEIRFVPHGATVKLQVYWLLDWEGFHLTAGLLSGASVPSSASVYQILLDEDVVVRKVDSEEYTLSEGVSYQPSWTSTLEEGINFTRSTEYLAGVGVDLQLVKADIGVRVSNILGKDIRRSTSRQSVTTLDGNVLQSARVDWFARIRPGKVLLEVDGATRELPFEYIIGFYPKVTCFPRSRPAVSNVHAMRAPIRTAEPAVDSSLPRLGRVTAVSKEWSRLFEARFETAVKAVKGDKLPVYRGRPDHPKCIGCCKVVAVRDYQVVAECEGFTPQVGDAIGGTVGE